jgi:hypothetical protein
LAELYQSAFMAWAAVIITISPQLFEGIN